MSRFARKVLVSLALFLVPSFKAQAQDPACDICKTWINVTECENYAPHVLSLNPITDITFPVLMNNLNLSKFHCFNITTQETELATRLQQNFPPSCLIPESSKDQDADDYWHTWDTRLKKTVMFKKYNASCQNFSLFDAVLSTPEELSRTEQGKATWETYRGTAYFEVYPNNTENLILKIPTFDAFSLSDQFLPSIVVAYASQGVPCSYFVDSSTSCEDSDDITVYANQSSWSDTDIKNLTFEESFQSIKQWLYWMFALMLITNFITIFFAACNQNQAVRIWFMKCLRFSKDKIKCQENSKAQSGPSLDIVRQCVCAAFCIFLLSTYTSDFECDNESSWVAIGFHFGLMLIFGYCFAQFAVLMRALRDPFDPEFTSPAVSTMFIAFSIFIGEIVWIASPSIEEHLGLIADKDLPSKYSFTDQYSVALIFGNVIAFGLVCTPRYWPHGLAWTYASSCTFALVRIVGRWSVGCYTVLNSDSCDTLPVYEFIVNHFGVCWVGGNQEGWNKPMWLTFYIPVMTISLWGVTTSLCAHWILTKYSDNSLSTQKTAFLTRCRTLVTAQSFLSLSVFTLFFINYQIITWGGSACWGGCMQVSFCVFVAMLLVYMVNDLGVEAVAFYEMVCKMATIVEKEEQLDTQMRVHLFNLLIDQIYSDKEDHRGGSTDDPDVYRATQAYFRKLRSKLEVKRHYNHTWGQLKHEKDRQLKAEGSKNSQSSVEPLVPLYNETTDHGGASGSFMFFPFNTNDYIIKTIPDHEAQTLMTKFLPKYYNHISDVKHESLLVKQLGLYKVQIAMIQYPVWFLVMESVHKGRSTKGDKSIKFDLKGSNNKGKNDGDYRDREMRKFLLHSLQAGAQIDLDQIRLNFSLTEEQKTAFRRNLSRDVRMLTDAGLMDYSLMVWCVEREDRGMVKAMKQVEETIAELIAGVKEISDNLSPTARRDNLFGGAEAVEMAMLGDYFEGMVQSFEGMQGMVLNRKADILDPSEIDIQQAKRKESVHWKASDMHQAANKTRTSEASPVATDLMRSSSSPSIMRSSFSPSNLTLSCDDDSLRDSGLDLGKDFLSRVKSHSPDIEKIDVLSAKLRAALPQAKAMKNHTLEAMLNTQLQTMSALKKGLQDIFLNPEPAKIPESVIGTCHYTINKNGQEETYRDFDIVCGISDVATEWGNYPQLTEIGKLISCHDSKAQKGCHFNDWGLSAKPPEIYGRRFEESLQVYFGVRQAEDKDIPELQRCCFLSAKPEDQIKLNNYSDEPVRRLSPANNLDMASGLENHSISYSIDVKKNPIARDMPDIVRDV